MTQRPLQFLLGFFAILLAGCAASRREEPPRIPVADHWSRPLPSTESERAVPWWEQFEISELTRVVRNALAANADLTVLAERVELTRAQARSLTAGSRPAVRAETSLSAGNERNMATDFETMDLLPWSVGGLASWEIDWLGKWRERRTAAEENVDASQSDFAAGRLLLTTEVVSAWFLLQQHAQEAAALRQSLDYQEQILERHRDRRQAGLSEAAVLDRQQAEISGLRRRIAEADQRREIAARRLDRLQGRSSIRGAYAAQPWDQAIASPDLPAVLPIDALRRRPDLRAAEARLRAAWSIAEAARLDLYPSLDLRLGGVTMTGTLSDPFRIWMTQIGPRMQIPLWDPNRRAAAQTASARAQLAAAEYRAAAIRVIEEIESALITHHGAGQQLEHAAQAAANAEAVVARSADLHRAGLLAHLDLLTDQRQALEARLIVIRLQARQRIAFANLRRSLGG